MLTWRQLVQMPGEALGQLDIALVNLACAAGLPGSEHIDIPHCLERLDSWAGYVRSYTDRIGPQFRRTPHRYHHSFAYFRTLAMITALQRDLKVRYNPEKIPDEAPFDTADTFIHGVIQGAGGTCASLPVVYAAVGRRLGYPIRLVNAPRHLFARWEEPGEVLNIEATAQGLTCPPDDYYRTGKYKTEEGNFLNSLTSKEELGSFLAQRGYRYGELDNYRDAAESFLWASVLDQRDRLHARSAMQALHIWSRRLQERLPPGFPYLRVEFPSRRYPLLPESVERYFITCEQLQACLEDPRHEHDWWEPLRRGLPPSRPVPVTITACVRQ
jgi:hypothetical protein